MYIKLWGTGSSVPTPARTTSRYGGNTSCASVRAPDGELFIPDAGIGLHWLGADLLSRGFADGGRAHILLSHLHWITFRDYPFCADADEWLPDSSLWQRWRYGSGSATAVPHGTRLLPGAGFFHGRYRRSVVGNQHRRNPFRIGSTTITPRQVNHRPPSSTFGFRLTNGQQSMAYIPDVEYLQDSHREPSLALADGVGLLIHDAHHTTAEYEPRRGDGHCSDADAVGLARDAAVGKILLFHHHPDHDDDAIDEVVRSHSGGEISVKGAAEHTEYTLGSC